MTSAVPVDHLQALGAGKATNYVYNKPAPELLETFTNPMAQRGYSIEHETTRSLMLHIEAPEFTSLCPLTGQPDFATIVIDYRPRDLCVESKSLKLYLGSFRNHGEFHESCVVKIGSDLADLLDPAYLKVEGRFTPRGGIPFWPTFEHFGKP